VELVGVRGGAGGGDGRRREKVGGRGGKGERGLRGGGRVREGSEREGRGEKTVGRKQWNSSASGGEGGKAEGGEGSRALKVGCGVWRIREQEGGGGK